jgi:hypothetical protein
MQNRLWKQGILELTVRLSRDKTGIAFIPISPELFPRALQRSEAATSIVLKTSAFGEAAVFSLGTEYPRAEQAAENALVVRNFTPLLLKAVVISNDLTAPLEPALSPN